MDITIGILLIIAAIFLIIAVLLQSDKDKNLSGAIAGGSAETFYSKNKSKGIDGWLPKVTTVVAIVFAVLVLVSFIIQDDTDLDDIYDELTAIDSESESAESSEESSAAGSESEGDESDSDSASGSADESADEPADSDSQSAEEEPGESSSAA